MDAADANDDGRINLLDPITIFQVLIGSLLFPPEPFLFLGPDPTPDSLDCLTPPPLIECN